MGLSTEVLVVAPLAVFFAYFIFGMTGFGSSIIAVPLLAHVLPLPFVVPLMVLLDFTAAMLVGRRAHRDVNKSEMKWLVPCFVAGMLIGVTLLIRLPREPLIIGLGVFVLAFGVYSMVDPHGGGTVSRGWVVPTGLVGGTFSALFGTGGPIYAIYLSRRILDKAELRATLVAVITISATLRSLFFLITGLLLQLRLLALVVLLMPVMFIATRAGTRVHVGMSQHHMRQALGGLLAVSGASLLWKALA